MIFRELKWAAQMWIPWRTLFVFIPNPKCKHDSNETMLETLSMSKKAVKMLLNIFGNVNAAARLA